ncbi:MAG: ABC transporter permease [Devosia sp.]|jgi:oligopeptide transport system permease protein|uniref:ABC transporter permease n=1 Tax=unclassified Devosia TaxID=196773 RepID=UPI00092C95D7|nr:MULTISPECIES: ABC transporter permease [unclassified Devosia]MBL8600176.1 ABC transporter permease [Devosia sp.]MBN9344909.1 ABC transporter permease [Devosia sp.]OJX48522.1 MAG: peptide ABC transporter permease [Devosia sp. 66-22]
MTGYVMQRLVLMLVTLLAIITLTFFLMHAVPGGPFVSDKMMAPEIQAAINAKYHLDDPVWLQYLNYLKGIASFDLGPSFKYAGMSVNEIIAEGLPTTLKVGVLALICVVSLGVPLGIVAALNRNRWPDTLVMVVATIGVAVPSYVIATVALYLFALRLGWVPTFGLDDWRGYFLPVFALSGFWISFIARLARSSLLETLQQDYMITAKAKGLKPGQILFKHGLRNSLIPVVTVLGPVVANLITGSFVIEQIFALPGIGRHFVLSITNRDYTAIMGITIFYAAVLMVMIFIVDMLYLVLDPRIKYREAR